MLTRLEVDGFKNPHGVVVDFGPFTCIAGANGIGKSNLFDAIRLLSLLAQHRIMEAARMVRGGVDDPTNPADLFPHGADKTSEMRLVAEMLVPLEVQDVFGQAVELVRASQSRRRLSFGQVRRVPLDQLTPGGALATLPSFRRLQVDLRDAIESLRGLEPG